MANPRKQAIKEAIHMIRSQASSILDDVMRAGSAEQACEILRTKLPDRKHLTYWLRQTKRSRDVKLGNGLDFQRYLSEVVKNIRGSNTNKDDQEETVTCGESDTEKKPPMPQTANQTSAFSLKLPPISGFDLTGVSHVQEYAIRTMLVFADCCVQSNPEGVFDVLARNFHNIGALCWWLQRIGKAELMTCTKNEIFVDAIKVVAHALHRELRSQIGRPVPRW